MNGAAHGYGVLTFARDDDDSEADDRRVKYSGMFKDGHMHGAGVMISKNGARYDGMWSEGEMNGHGVYMYAHGEQYDGDFVHGKFDGVGVYRWCDGRMMAGQWVDGRVHGLCIFWNADGKRSECARCHTVNGDVEVTEQCGVPPSLWLWSAAVHDRLTPDGQSVYYVRVLLLQ